MSGQLVRKALRLTNLKRFSLPVSRCQGKFYSGTKSVIIFENETSYDPGKKPTAIEVPEKTTIYDITGIPEEHIKERYVRIYRRAKNVMQSGTDNCDHWQLEFDTRARWENPLMGWSSSGDPHSNVKIEFHDLNSAVNYAEKNGWKWFMEPERKMVNRSKSYGHNFSWNKRTRVSTK